MAALTRYHLHHGSDRHGHATNSAANRLHILQEVQSWILKHRVSSAATELDPIKVVRFIIKEFHEGFEVDPTFHKLRLGIKAIKARWDTKIMHETITFRRPQAGQTGNPKSGGNNQKKRKRNAMTSTARTNPQSSQPQAKRPARKKFCLCCHTP